MDEQIVRHIYEPSRQEVKVKLVKNTRAYGWEISVARENSEEALSELKSLDERLRQTLIERGRHHVARFSWERTARIFRAHYRRLTNRPLTDEDQELLAASMEKL